MKRTHVRKTAYKRISLMLCGALACGLLFTGDGHAAGKVPVDEAATEREEGIINNNLSSYAKDTLSKEEYEALVAEDYKQSGGMVKFGNYRKRYNVNKTTLFIGTYLIEFSALNETYYRLAGISKTQRNQDIEFYKSEIHSAGEKNTANDVWVELVGADYAALTTGDSKAESDLDGYWISCVITDEGAFDPMTGEAKDIMGDDLYDLMNLPEMLPLKNKYDEIEEKAGRTDDEARHNYYTRNMLISIDDDVDEGDLETFKLYENNGRNDVTNRCDIEINNLKNFYSLYSGEEDELTAEKAAVILDLYARDDARRRVEIYGFLAVGNDGNSAALKCMEDIIGQREEKGVAGFKADDEYIAAIEESMANCKESYNMYLSMVPTKGTTVLSEYRFLWGSQMLDSAYDNKLDEDGEKWLRYIMADDNIGAGEIKDAEFETVVLQTILLPEGIKRYENKVLTEVTKDYTTALAEGKSEDAKNEILMAQYDDAVRQMQELEFLVKSTCDRLEKADAVRLVQEQIEIATLWKTLVFDDPYGPLADYCIDLYIDWLYKLYQEITEGDSEFNMEDPIDDLDEAKKRAEEDGDLEKLKQLEALEGKYGKNGSREGEDGDGLDGLDDSNTFKDMLDRMNENELIKDLGNHVNEDLNNNNYTAYDAYLRLLGDKGFDPDDFGGNGFNIGDDGSGNGGNGNNGSGDNPGDNDGIGGNGSDPYSDGQDRGKRRDNENYGRNYGGGDYTGDGSDKPWNDASAYDNYLNPGNDGSEYDLTDKQIEDLLKSLYGVSFDELDPDAQAAVVVALNRYGKMHNASNCLAYARKLLTKIMGNKNPLVYAQYEQDHTAEYISLGAMDYSRVYTGFRYVFIDGIDTVSQTNGTASYSFAGNRVTLSNGETQDMSSSIGYQIDDYIKNGTRFAYINEIDAMKYLVETGEYIVDTDWAVLVTARMETEVSKIIEALTQLIEGK
ncbi:MAG: hypothetical protein IJT72_09170 [Lachnospiraceae bacterium]|nr:hypothetical protein [Lachnospiraceae bacterium]